MSPNYISLDRLPIGCRGKVKDLRAQDNIRRRMLDLGLISDTVVQALCQSPSGDPHAYQIRGAVFALRSSEASKVLVEIV